jgi:hypothetical protein
MLFTHIKMSQNAGWWTPLIVLDAIGPRCQRVDQLTPTNFSVFWCKLIISMSHLWWITNYWLPQCQSPFPNGCGSLGTGGQLQPISKPRSRGPRAFVRPWISDI